ncbi:MAG: hypothetical protein V4850_13910 [Myxococcota bacterium]
MSALALFVLVPFALGAPCPPPTLPPAPGFTTVTPDGAAHILARDEEVACWWVVDDAGDGRVAARWDRSRRDPLGVTTLADGRAVVVLLEPGARVLVRTEAGDDARWAIDPAWLADLLASRPLALGGTTTRGWDDARR